MKSTKKIKCNAKTAVFVNLTIKAVYFDTLIQNCSIIFKCKNRDSPSNVMKRLNCYIKSSSRG